jgi:uncharacterized protein YdaU (DUF1376 family)
MALYIADYLADTAHLRAAQSGAYLHLIMHYWQHGRLPDDNAQLASIAKMTDQEWKKARPIIEPFFQMPGWRHKRIDEELATADAKYEKRAEAGKRGGEASGIVRAKQKQVDGKNEAMLPKIESKNEAMLQQTPSKSEANTNQPQPQPHKDGRDGSAPEPSKPEKQNSLIGEEAFTLAPKLLALMGVEDGHPLSMAAPYTVQMWLNGGWPEEAIKAGVERAMHSKAGDPPSTLKYFEKAIARAHAELTRKLPVVNIQPGEITTERPNGRIPRSGRSLNAAIDRALAESIEEDRLAAMHESSVPLLSN